MRTHHVWRPLVDRDPIFNPFESVMQRNPAHDRVALASTEEEEVEKRIAEQASDQTPAGK